MDDATEKPNIHIQQVIKNLGKLLVFLGILLITSLLFLVFNKFMSINIFKEIYMFTSNEA